MTLRDDSRKIMDDPVTLRLFMSFSGVGILVTGSILGFMWNDILTNRLSLTHIPAQIDLAIATSSKFHTDQRIRVWDRVEANENQMTVIGKNQARLEGRLEGLLKELDRMIARLDKLNDSTLGSVK